MLCLARICHTKYFRDKYLFLALDGLRDRLRPRNLTLDASAIRVGRRISRRVVWPLRRFRVYAREVREALCDGRWRPALGLVAIGITLMIGLAFSVPSSHVVDTARFLRG